MLLGDPKLKTGNEERLSLSQMLKKNNNDHNESNKFFVHSLSLFYAPHYLINIILLSLSLISILFFSCRLYSSCESNQLFSYASSSPIQWSSIHCFGGQAKFVVFIIFIERYPTSEGLLWVQFLFLSLTCFTKEGLFSLSLLFI